MLQLGMANPWGTKLSRAIRERAYSSAAVERMEKRVEALLAELASARSDLDAAKEYLANLDQKITTLSAINVSEIRQINKIPKSGLFKHGELATAIVRVLKDASVPLETPRIIIMVARMLDLPIDSSKDWADTRLRIKKQLQAYARKGVIERHHNLHASKIGSWKWGGL
jgi:hypothetical protein